MGLSLAEAREALGQLLAVRGLSEEQFTAAVFTDLMTVDNLTQLRARRDALV